MIIPKTIVIGTQVWNVERRKPDGDEDGEYAGLTIPKARTILLDPDIHGDMEEETLLHEILHACWTFTGLENGKPQSEEDIVNRLAPVLLMVMRENPLTFSPRH